MKIEAGKYYRTRDGRKVGPMRRYNGGADGFSFCFGGATYNSYGGFYSSGTSANDLIAEWEEPMTYKEIGTLAEIGAKAGDVVIYVGDDATSSNIMRTVAGKGTDKLGEERWYHADQDFGGREFMTNNGPWQMIRRATEPAPVNMSDFLQTDRARQLDKLMGLLRDASAAATEAGAYDVARKVIEAMAATVDLYLEADE